MRLNNGLLRHSRTAVVTAALLAVSGWGFAQDKTATIPDAQIEASVLKALAGAPDLADQSINTTTVYGTVTLSGTVRDEASRDKAEQLAAHVQGVKKVVDELVISGGPAVATSAPQAPADQNNNEGSNPNLQSDGTMAPPQSAGQQPEMQQQAPQQAAPYGQQPQGQPGPQSWPQQQAGPGQAPAYPPPPYQRSSPYPYGQPPAYDYPQQPQYGYPQPQYGYPQQPQYGYPQQPQRVIVQQAGQTVIVPAGTVLRVRVNQAMESRKTQPGMAFDGVVLADVIVGNEVAIPRGANVQGEVVDAQPGTPLRGRGGLALELTQVVLEGNVYPLTTGEWTQAGVDKTGQTVGTTIGLGALGAVIGGAAGGGPGAVLGAGIGGAAGLGLSGAGSSGEAKIPAEAILDFRLTQQAALMTVSQAELDRLGAGLPQPSQQLQRRYAYPAYPAPPPPPPGYYYGPAYYPYYPYGYYRY